MKAHWRARFAVVGLVAACFAIPTAGPVHSAAMQPAAPGTRAMWLWSNPEDPAAIIEWSVVRGLQEIFVYVDTDVATNGTLPGLKELKKRADIDGIRLSALGGDPSWTLNHAVALSWAKAVKATGLFTGLHLDVEPYLLPQWTTNQNSIAKNYLTLLDVLRIGSGQPIDADVPFWYGQYTVGGKNLATEILKRVNAVTVMSYRDTGTGPNSILEVGRDWLVRGAAAGRRVRLGAETGPLSDCAYCTFAEEGATRLGNELAKVDAATR
jgi:hypothetical protein